MPQDLLGLQGKVALVTGSGQGIGRACAVMFGQAGARVVVVDIDGQKADDTAAQVRAKGGEAIAVHADVRRPADIQRMMSAALERFGGLDVGVNNVGGTSKGWGSKLTLDSTMDDWLAIVEQNLYTAVQCSQAYARSMIERKVQGVIIEVASPAGLRAAVRLGPYGAAKAGVINLTQTLAVELAASGIRVNCVVPAFVATNALTQGTWMRLDDQLALAKKAVPMGRQTKPEEVAGAIVAMSSNLTSFCTGQVLVVDGGRLAVNPVAATV